MNDPRARRPGAAAGPSGRAGMPQERTRNGRRCSARRAGRGEAGGARDPSPRAALRATPAPMEPSRLRSCGRSPRGRGPSRLPPAGPHGHALQAPAFVNSGVMPLRGRLSGSNVCASGGDRIGSCGDVSGREGRPYIGAPCPLNSVVSERDEGVIGDRPRVGRDPVWKNANSVSPRSACPPQIRCARRRACRESIRTRAAGVGR